MVSKKVVILGAGIGGILAARGVKDKFPETSVTLVGPRQDQKRPGLFYFNKKIPGVAEKEIDVEYNLVGEGSIKDYQLKSRGYCDERMSKSSFTNIGKVVKGYLLNSDLSLEGIDHIPEFCSQIDLLEHVVVVGELYLSYDILISTIPIKNFLEVTGSPRRPDDEVFVSHSKPVFQKVSGYSEVDDSQIDMIRVFYDLSDSMYYRHSSYYNGQDIVKMVSESINPRCIHDEETISYPGKIIPSPVISQIVQDIEEIFYPDVKICGRYARWDYHYTVDQTYEDAIKFVESRT